LDKVALQTTDLLIQKIVRLVNQADSYVGDHLKRAGLAEFAISLIGHMRVASESPNKTGLAALLFPNRKVSYPE
jgi:hypothetical protein